MFADVDECAMSGELCHGNAKCNNTLGGFTCWCMEGFTGDGHKSCVGGWELKRNARNFRISVDSNSRFCISGLQNYITNKQTINSTPEKKIQQQNEILYVYVIIMHTKVFTIH